ncbi:MAG: OmpA family protein [Nitrospiria bacterium]
MARPLRYTSHLFLFLLSLFLIQGCVTKNRYLLEVKKREALERALHAQEKINTRLKKERQGIRTQLSAMRQRIKQSSLKEIERINLAQNQIEQRRRIRIQQEKMVSLRTALEQDKQALERQMTTLKNTLSDEGRKISELQGRLDAVTTKSLALENMLAQTKTTAEAATHEALETVRAREARIKALQQKIEKRNQEIITLAQAEKQAEQKRREAEETLRARAELIKNLQAEINAGHVKIIQMQDRLSVQIVDKILFSTGSTEINSEGQRVLKKVSGTLKNIKKKIRIEGHTDNVPIRGLLAYQYPTNWELSTARATQVVRYLVGEHIDPKNLLAVGMAEFNPVASNDTPEGRQQNRRIEILLSPR